jgi:hypothetical protein
VSALIAFFKDFIMGKIVTCTVHKGGTGKTTLSVALACQPLCNHVTENNPRTK